MLSRWESDHFAIDDHSICEWGSFSVIQRLLVVVNPLEIRPLRYFDDFLIDESASFSVIVVSENDAGFPIIGESAYFVAHFQVKMMPIHQWENREKRRGRQYSLPLGTEGNFSEILTCFQCTE